DRLLAAEAEAAMGELLLPLCAVATPNLPEARILAGTGAEDEAGMRRLAEALVERGAAAALVKGGHREGDEVVDVLFDGTSFWTWRRAKLVTGNTHGTGCTLSSAIAAGLARGWALEDAVDTALDYVHRAIAAAPGLGAGHGPLNHFVEVQPPRTNRRNRSSTS
ncbi:MAG: bifunctional hydroxymethylpyrimidine kinase/phosphomethylpyrimidine kinase, partial [Gemmatimonadetes bacterium]|nr:bifunctional hydroxymethylpyrimidine kinase/phosphomethylpyrimidine kinase [Gemmatimonadota bacterium]NIQ53810.1 bifunctional hydroxymethylpyrimidine kinase/phosphomethylpyrimidine kinase [Gemmatimonadota bacterium]NIU73983.1 bifunctional hydroxymethylpyrimidine kinase/phosphomethylpyrimidine kinase [Gammaproteobacteria bacterium]NIX44051.1 bifunctional hydroxymethylpyrimidine kinase/phosphomethylpyrimidine kinase [Gemmatimonadota bacterium]